MPSSLTVTKAGDHAFMNIDESTHLWQQCRHHLPEVALGLPSSERQHQFFMSTNLIQHVAHPFVTVSQSHGFKSSMQLYYLKRQGL